MKPVLGVDSFALPAIWDADVLYGPKAPAGKDTYVVCEINVSTVWPFPDKPPTSSLGPQSPASRRARPSPPISDEGGPRCAQRR